jgi:hypothetical protein
MAIERLPRDALIHDVRALVSTSAPACFAPPATRLTGVRFGSPRAMFTQRADPELGQTE